ncbi:MAG: DUF4345 domain-containing protein [Flavipsychrobacter sp.]
MNSNKLTSLFLVIAGLIGLAVGVGLTFFPVSMQAQYDIIMQGNVSQLSEIRAPGLSILSISVIILIGAFRVRWRYIALLLSALVFLSYGVGRLLSLALDGIPAQGLMVAMLVELIIGLLALLALRKVKVNID